MTNHENPTASEKKEVITELIGFEISKLKNTVRDLTSRPGVAIDDYSRGDRTNLLSPIAYFLLIFGVSFFIDSVSGVSDFIMGKSLSEFGTTYASGMKKAEADSGKKLGLDVSKTSEKVEAEIKAFFQRKEAQLIIILPGLLLGQWLFFRKQRPSFLHNSYFALYTLGHYVLLLMPVSLLFFVSENLFYYTYLVLGVVVPIMYNTYSGVNFYAKDWRPLIVKNILLYLTVFVVGSIATGLLIIGVAAYVTMTSIN